MITIQGFAKLCGCNAQTLRYYDKIGLLAPAKVDEWTGYRYYEEEQAMLFVKIKNLQLADFSIEEIKGLLDQDDEALARAFEVKIKEQQAKLEQIKKIQESYLIEKMEMKKIVNTMSKFIEEQVQNPALWEECGVDPKEETQLVAKAHELLANWMTQCKEMGEEVFLNVDDREVAGAKKIGKMLEKGDWKEAQKIVLSKESRKDEEGKIPADAKLLFERHDWAHVSDWIDELPARAEGDEYYFRFNVAEDSAVLEPGFTMTFMLLMAAEYENFIGGINCFVNRSQDGKNHFEMLKK